MTMFGVMQFEQLPKFFQSATQSMRDAALGAALTGGGPLACLSLRQRQFRSEALHDVLPGRHVLISGASSGIGRAVALQVAEAGATAVIVARSDDKLRELKREIERSGGRAFAYSADLSSPESTQSLLEQLARDGVQIDVLINNAGRSIRRPVHESYERVHDYERTMALNYFGSLRLILGVLPGMRARKQGHIINVSSAGAQLGTPLFAAYIASKAALDAFTRVAAGESREDGVRFTTVYMPLVRTPMIEPTEAYRDVSALSPDEAASLVLRALVTGEKQLGTSLGQLVQLGYLLAPEAIERVINSGR
jgi:short-subunit dehydrogenase